MPDVARLTDLSINNGTPMVVTPVVKTYVNGLLAGVVSTECQYATKGSSPQPARYIKAGAQKTFIEGYAAARYGDPLADNDAVGHGSPNTFIE
jgi:uncharacterized Zn-binding protein involved in type VI secretion